MTFPQYHLEKTPNLELYGHFLQMIISKEKKNCKIAPGSYPPKITSGPSWACLRPIYPFHIYPTLNHHWMNQNK